MTAAELVPTFAAAIRAFLAWWRRPVVAGYIALQDERSGGENGTP